MMLAGLLICVRENAAWAGESKALDPEFLDYLLACEGKDDNWTVVADRKLRKKADKSAEPAEPAEPKEKSPPVEDRKPEAKP